MELSWNAVPAIMAEFVLPLGTDLGTVRHSLGKTFGIPICYDDNLAEREGFEPPIGLHLCRISSAVHSTTLPPLLKAPNRGTDPRGRGVF